MDKTKMADDNNKDEVHGFNFTPLTKLIIFFHFINPCMYGAFSGSKLKTNFSTFPYLLSKMSVISCL